MRKKKSKKHKLKKEHQSESSENILSLESVPIASKEKNSLLQIHDIDEDLEKKKTHEMVIKITPTSSLLEISSPEQKKIQIPLSSRSFPSVSFQLLETNYLQALLFFFLFIAGCYIVYCLRSVLTPICCALVFAYIVEPFVNHLEKMGASRRFAIAFLLLSIMSGLFLVIVSLLPSLGQSVDQLMGLVAKFPSQIEHLKNWMQTTFHISFPKTWTEAFTQWGGQIKDYAPKVIQPITLAISTVFSSGLHVVFVGFQILLVPLFAYYFLKDFRSIRMSCVNLIPPRWRVKALKVWTDVDLMLSGFIRGQMIVGFIVGSLYLFLLSVLQLPLAPAIAIFGGAINLVPYIGFLVTYLIAILVTLIDFQSFTQVWGVVIGLGLIHLFDVLFISPRIVGEKVGLSELIVIVSVLAGGHLFGIIGVFLSVPLAAISKVFMKECMDQYRKSEFFLGKHRE